MITEYSQTMRGPIQPHRAVNRKYLFLPLFSLFSLAGALGNSVPDLWVFLQSQLNSDTSEREN